MISRNIAEKNGMWKGDKVGYTSLHNWIKRRLLKPEACQNCLKQTTKLDLANISQKYKRNLSDWEWLCRKCHMIKDKRLEKLIKNSNNQLGKSKPQSYKNKLSIRMKKQWKSVIKDSKGRIKGFEDLVKE